METLNWGYALLVTIMGISTVFIMLIILIGVINLQNFVMNGNSKKAEVKAAESTPTSTPSTSKEDEKEADRINAVIATAVHLHLKAKNSANFITIKRISNSPWSVKQFN